MSKREKFVRLATGRVNKAIKEIQLIGNLSNRTYYEYSNADIEKIFGELREQLRISREKFNTAEKKNRKQQFTLD